MRWLPSVRRGTLGAMWPLSGSALQRSFSSDSAIRDAGVVIRLSAIVMGLVLSYLQSGSGAAWNTALALAILAGIVYLPFWRSSRNFWPAVLEMATAGLVLGLGIPLDYEFLPYLLTAGAYWGLRGGWLPSLTGVGAAAVTLLVPQILAEGDIDSITAVSMTEWLLLAAFGAGAGSWSRTWQNQRHTPPDRYRDAYRLLVQLREVTRQLPATLDEVGAASKVLDSVLQHSPSEVAVLMRIDGDGPPLPVAIAGEANLSWYPGLGSGLMVQMVEANSAVQAMVWLDDDQREPRAGYRAHRALVPIHLERSRIGVIALQRSASWTPDELTTMQHAADEAALMLDTAFVFGDVRMLATMEERRRLARETHDGIAQEIAGLAYAVDDISARADEDLRADLDRIRAELSRLVSELRLSIFELRTGVESGVGLGASISDYVRQVGARSGMTVHIVLDEESSRFSPDIEIEIMRIVQEAVTNARRHSHANNLWVTLRSAPPLALVRVADDGIGISDRRSDSYGMEIMRERASRIGGRFETRARAGGGTVVELILDESTTQPAPMRNTTNV